MICADETLKRELSQIFSYENLKLYYVKIYVGLEIEYHLRKYGAPNFKKILDELFKLKLRLSSEEFFKIIFEYIKPDADFIHKISLCTKLFIDPRFSDIKILILQYLKTNCYNNNNDIYLRLDSASTPHAIHSQTQETQTQIEVQYSRELRGYINIFYFRHFAMYNINAAKNYLAEAYSICQFQPNLYPVFLENLFESLTKLSIPQETEFYNKWLFEIALCYYSCVPPVEAAQHKATRVAITLGFLTLITDNSCDINVLTNCFIELFNAHATLLKQPKFVDSAYDISRPRNLAEILLPLWLFNPAVYTAAAQQITKAQECFQFQKLTNFPAYDVIFKPELTFKSRIEDSELIHNQTLINHYRR